MKYAMTVKTKEGKYFHTIYSNNLEYFDAYKNKSNYLATISEKVSNKWKIIYEEK